MVTARDKTSISCWFDMLRKTYSSYFHKYQENLWATLKWQWTGKKFKEPENVRLQFAHNSNEKLIWSEKHRCNLFHIQTIRLQFLKPKNLLTNNNSPNMVMCITIQRTLFWTEQRSVLRSHRSNIMCANSDNSNAVPKFRPTIFHSYLKFLLQHDSLLGTLRTCLTRRFTDTDSRKVACLVKQQQYGFASGFCSWDPAFPFEHPELKLESPSSC